MVYVVGRRNVMWSKGRERERQRIERERKNKCDRVSITGSFFKCPQQLGLSKGESRNQDLNQDLPPGWWEPKYLSHHQLPPSIYISRKQDWMQRSQNSNLAC